MMQPVPWCRSPHAICSNARCSVRILPVKDLTLYHLALPLQVSLPMLAPLLLGTGMLFRSIRSNASFLFPRIGLVVVLLWVLWFVNSVVQNTVWYLRRQGALDDRVSGAIITGQAVCQLFSARRSSCWCANLHGHPIQRYKANHG